jgi:probable rRNA maturation factor
MFTLTNTTKSTPPSVPFVKIKNAVLGKNYDLSLVFIGEKKSKKLNFSYRGKNKPTNILSFTLDKNSGEIFITPSVAKKQLKIFNRKYNNFVAFLFIHGLLHLKGMEHGSTMEEAEEKLRKKFSV